MKDLFNSKDFEIVYEVNLSINRDTYEEHGMWFLEHIQEMVTKNNFSHAEILHQIDLDPTNDSSLRVKNLTVRYYIESLELLNIYLEKKAKEMRSQVVEKFKNNYSIHRRVFAIQKDKESQSCLIS